MSVTKDKKEKKIDEVLSQPWVLILENDDYNTFDWVITCLIEICGHDYDQASQCAHIVHFNGRCDVKYGDFETISEMKEKLRNSGLSATAEKNN